MAKILVVDDNRDNLNVVSRMLELRGHRPDVAENGVQALERARRVRPDLVLMDLSMPEMDGWQASSQFRDDEVLRDIPVVAVTGHVTRDEIERAQRAGCVDVVSKPIDFYVLMDKIALHTTPIGTAQSAGSSS